MTSVYGPATAPDVRPGWLWHKLTFDEPPAIFARHFRESRYCSSAFALRSEPAWSNYPSIPVSFRTSLADISSKDWFLRQLVPLLLSLLLLPFPVASFAVSWVRWVAMWSRIRASMLLNWTGRGNWSWPEKPESCLDAFSNPTTHPSIKILNGRRECRCILDKRVAL